MRFTALMHHITPPVLLRSFLHLKRAAVPGIDGVTWDDYAEGLEERIADLHNRIHRGTQRRLRSDVTFGRNPWLVVQLRFESASG
jgi:hypothetical protein